MIEAGDQLKQNLLEESNQTWIKDIFSEVDETTIEKATDFVYENLPLFLTEKDYQHFDSLLTQEGIEAMMRKNYTNLISPAGIALRGYIQRDPLGLGNNVLKHLQDFQLETNYEINNGHIFSKDGNTLLMFMTPVFGTGSTGENENLIRILEMSCNRFRTSILPFTYLTLEVPLSVSIMRDRLKKIPLLLLRSHC